MSLTRRGRRAWRIILSINVASGVVSACFSVLSAPDGANPWVSALFGVIASIMIATPIVFFELRSASQGPLRRLRRLPLVLFFTIKVLVYLAVIICALLLVRLLFMPSMPDRFTLGSLFEGLAFAAAMSVFGNLVFEMGRLLGFGTLKNFLTGRYVHPKREERAFLLIDMKDSTGLAERLGAIRFHELLNQFFRDIADAALECEAEIHKYVGDEAILTWPSKRALADGDVLTCPFIALDFIAANRSQYSKRFGVAPEFRAALHYGEIVAGEIGDLRREIAYVGDTLNVAARLLDAAKTLGRDVLVSADLLARSTLPAGVVAEPLRTLTVRGREAPLEIAALSRS